MGRCQFCGLTRNKHKAAVAAHKLAYDKAHHARLAPKRKAERAANRKSK